jgi:hypothetical protein
VVAQRALALDGLKLRVVLASGQGGDDHGQGDDEHHNQCTTADLMSGTPVKFPDLSMSSAGTNWDVVVLETQPSTVPTVPDTDNDGD